MDIWGNSLTRVPKLAVRWEKEAPGSQLTLISEATASDAKYKPNKQGALHLPPEKGHMEYL